MADPKKSRGYRNKNPGNIDYNPANKWQGQIGKEAGSSGRFAVFQTHEYGIRALAMLLTTYYDRHGLRTPRSIINRWAPPNENLTSSYVVAVSRQTGFGPDQVLDLHTYEHMRPLVEAIITHELGGNPYPPRVIDEGLRLAGITRPVAGVADVVKTDTGKGALAVGAAGALVALKPGLDVLADLPPWLGVAVVVSAVALVLVWRLKR